MSNNCPSLTIDKVLDRIQWLKSLNGERWMDLIGVVVSPLAIDWVDKFVNDYCVNDIIPCPYLYPIRTDENKDKDIDVGIVMEWRLGDYDIRLDIGSVYYDGWNLDYGAYSCLNLENGEHIYRDDLRLEDVGIGMDGELISADDVRKDIGWVVAELVRIKNLVDEDNNKDENKKE